MSLHQRLPTLFLQLLALYMPISIATESVAKASNSTSNITSILQAYPTWTEFATRFLPVALYVDRYVTLVLYVIGFPGNFISMIVWTSRRVYKENSAAIYLAALSLNDICVLIFALFRDLQNSWQVHLYFTTGYCEVLGTLTPAVQYASPLFVLGFTVERWLAICHPFSMDRICSVKRALIICVVIMIGTVLVCSGNAYIFTTLNGSCEKRSPNSTVANVYLTLLEIIFSGLVPLLVLLFNCLVIREMARIHRANRHLATISTRLIGQSSTNGTRVGFMKRGIFKRSKKCLGGDRYGHVAEDRWQEQANHGECIGENGAQTETSQGQPNGGGRRPNDCTSVVICEIQPDQNTQTNQSRNSPSFRSTTLMLLIVSFYMIITTLVGGLIYLLHQTHEAPPTNIAEEEEILAHPIWIRFFRIRTIKAFGDEFALSYYAVGFIIYYSTGHSFRQRVHQLLRHLLFRCGCRCTFFDKLGDSDDFEFTSRQSKRRRPTLDDRLRNRSLSTSLDPRGPSRPRRPSPLHLVHDNPPVAGQNLLTVSHSPRAHRNEPCTG